MLRCWPERLVTSQFLIIVLGAFVYFVLYVANFLFFIRAYP